MTSTPSGLGSCRRDPNNWSAGGQLEHPSDVNSSTTTALRAEEDDWVALIRGNNSTTSTPAIRMSQRNHRNFIRNISVTCLSVTAAGDYFADGFKSAG